MSLVQRTLFAQDSVKQLHQSDFLLDSDTKIFLKHKECMLVLFYIDNLESNNLVEIWSVAASSTVGPIFGACNLMVEREVATAFNQLNTVNSSLHWAALKTLPFILIYQNGQPIAFYNGERSVQSIIDYSLTLACKAEYHEHFNLFGGQVVSNDKDLMMKGLTQYGIKSNPFKKDSLLYTADEDIRGYDKDDSVVPYKSSAEREASRHVLANEQQAGVGIKTTIVPPTAKPTPEEKASEVEGNELRQSLLGGTRVPERPAQPTALAPLPALPNQADLSQPETEERPAQPV